MLKDIRFIKTIAILVVSVCIQPTLLISKERGSRGIENQTERAQERAINRALARAQVKAERAAERSQDKTSDEVSLNKGAGSENADALIQRIKMSNKNSEQHQKNLKLLEKKYHISFVINQGRGILIRSGEIIALDISSQGILAAKQLMLKVIRSYEFKGIGIKADVFITDKVSDLTSIIDALRKADPKGQYEYNMVYQKTGLTSVEKVKKSKLINKYDRTFTVGLIDTGVNIQHESIKHLTIIQENFGRGENVIPRNHGTAISSIIGRYGNAKIYVADVFSGIAGYSDSEAIIKALNWLTHVNTGVINMSLAGPDSFVLKQAISNLINKGHLIVAAVGNEGVGGPARFPAAYEQVIGVTAVDEKLNVYNKANQDSYVDIAAPGVNIVASAIVGEQKYSGTSFATAFVSAALAPELNNADKIKSVEVLQRTMLGLTDLGQTGYDPIFGFGLLNTKKYYPAGE